MSATGAPGAAGHRPPPSAKAGLNLVVERPRLSRHRVQTLLNRTAQLLVLAWIIARFLWSGVFKPIVEGHRGDFVQSVLIPPGTWWYSPLYQWLASQSVTVFTLAQLLQFVFILNLLFVGGAFWTCVRVFSAGRALAWDWLLLGLLWADFYPLLDALGQNNVEVGILFLVSLSAWAAARGRDGLTGVLLALPGVLKVLYLPLIAYAYLRWRGSMAIWATVCATVLLGAVALAAYPNAPLGELYNLVVLGEAEGLGTEAYFRGELRGSLMNQSLSGFIYRKLFSDIPVLSAVGDTPRGNIVGGPFPPLVVAASIGVSVLAVALYLRSRRIPFDPGIAPWEIGITTLVLLLIVPVAYVHYHLLTLPAFTALFFQLRSEPLSRGIALRWGLFATSAVALGILVPPGLLDAVGLNPFPFIFIDGWKSIQVPFLGLVALLLLTLERYPNAARNPHLAEREPVGTERGMRD